MVHMHLRNKRNRPGWSEVRHYLVIYAIDNLIGSCIRNAHVGVARVVMGHGVLRSPLAIVFFFCLDELGNGVPVPLGEFVA